ncbi:SusC/RagA family TonB-linked outer membrane protein [Hymenobacter lapidiphilus]|uniref:SusC/RagA family TonB-linked outer membrane protein n=1 Tax=Hymenobacter sp. CCM 8763 TaxID=2303334 RepID=UPI000E34E369|nr:SusC/RagA family TonB-linked outer membrane protein [Hymenobacter sp. CCM 8763]RFP64656.1 SusC/RagA family TonB-linked outer membrane protein [Hymenobacter sp. CCM 8763]
MKYPLRFLKPAATGSPGRAGRVARTTVLFSLAACLQVHALAYSQNINLEVRNAPLSEVFKEINRQSRYLFIYNEELLRKARPVTVSARQQPLEQVLAACFANQPLTYVITDNTIVVKPREEAPTTSAKQARQTISGIVTSGSDQKPLEGATVSVKGTSRGSTTDASGRFTLEAEVGEILAFSYVGYITQEIRVAAGRTTFSIPLQPTSNQMGEVEVVATGYQEIEKERLTGSVSSLNREQYDQRVAVTGNFLESLEGKVPGLLYNSQTGELAIRGVSTFDAVKQPLIVLNGFPTEIDIRSINPNDIVSVNVLKDAAAASIYGTRASNGVIVIETKRGKSGAPVFSLRATYGVQPRSNFDYLNYGSVADYANLERDYLLSSTLNRASTRPGVPVSPVADAVYDFKAGKIERSVLDQRVGDIGSYDNLKEYEKLFYRARQARQVDFDMSGGGDKNTYLIGLNYLGEDAQNVRTGNERILLNLASTHRFTNRLSFEFRGRYANTTTRAPFNSASNTAGEYLNNFLPYERLVDENGQALPVTLGPGRNPNQGITNGFNEQNVALGLYDGRYFPYQELTASTTKINSTTLRLQGRLRADLTNWLNLDLGSVYEDQPSTESRLLNEDALAVRRLLNYKAGKDPVNGTPVFSDLPRGSFLTRVNGQTKSYTLRGQLNADHSSENLKHTLTGLAGMEVRKVTNSDFTNTFFGYDGQTLIVKPVNLANLTTFRRPAFSTLPASSPATFQFNRYFDENYNDQRFVSFYGNAAYTYFDRYTLTGSIRLDKSNLFGTDPRYRNNPFYSVGANWRLKQEDFLRDTEWVDELKLRVAYGLNGNVPTSNSGRFLVLTSDLNYYLDPVQQYYDVLSPRNQSIRWEKTKNYNAGLDYSLFGNRLFGAVDYYLKNSDDIFGQYSADPTLGFNEYRANTAAIRNQGLEFSVNSLNLRARDFSWRTQLTASFNKNEVTKVKTVTNTADGAPLISVLSLQQGYPINSLFAYRYAGLNELGQPEIFGQDGTRRQLAISASGGENITLADLEYKGSTTPRYVLGLNNQLSYKNFDLYFLFMYYGGYVMRVEAPDPLKAQLGGGAGRVLAGANNYWQQPGDEQTTNIPGFPVGGTPGAYDSYTRSAYTFAGDFVRKADNIRLRDIVLSYNLKSAFFTNLGLERTQLRGQVQNAFNYTFSGNDIDPDAIDRRDGTRTLRPKPFYSLSLYANF